MKTKTTHYLNIMASLGALIIFLFTGIKTLGFDFIVLIVSGGTASLWISNTFDSHKILKQKKTIKDTSEDTIQKVIKDNMKTTIFIVSIATIASSILFYYCFKTTNSLYDFIILTAIGILCLAGLIFAISSIISTHYMVKGRDEILNRKG